MAKTKRRTGPRRAKKEITILERRAKVFELRKRGNSMRAIAVLLKVSLGTVANDLTEELKELSSAVNESADTYRRLEIERLNDISRVLYSKTLKGQVGVIDRQVRVIELRAKIEGLFSRGIKSESDDCFDISILRSRQIASDERDKQVETNPALSGRKR